MSQEYRFDFANLSKSPWVGELTRYLADYEKKAKKLIQELDSKSQLARKKGLQNLEKLSAQVARTRHDLEKKVTLLLQKESKRLNEGVNEFLDYVRSIAKTEKVAAPKRQTKAKKARTVHPSRPARPRTRRITKAAAAPLADQMQESAPPAN